MVLDIEKILRLNQEDLLNFNYIELIKRGYRNKDIIYTDDYIYAKGNIPILLVAHCDIVHKHTPDIIVNDKKQRILWSPTGIGGDDRCGVYAILKICEKFKPYVLFTTEEEVGGLGVKKFTKEIDEIPVNFIIEIDRKGNEEVVFYQCGNKDFQNYIISFGFDKEFGSYSDVSTLSTHYDIAGCNVSAGYYNQHTIAEHIYMEDLENTIDKVINILKDTANCKFYDCQEIVYKPTKFEQDYYWDEKDQKWKLRQNKSNEVEENEEYNNQQQIIDDYMLEKELYQKEDDFYDLTKQEWKEKYGTEKPKDILDIYK